MENRLPRRGTYLVPPTGPRLVATVRSRAWTALLVAAVTLSCDSPTGFDPNDYPRNPADAQFVVDDIRRFWHAWDAGGRYGNAEPFQTRYLDSATPGLISFMRTRSVTAVSIANIVESYPAYYAALRPVSSSITLSDPVFAEVRANYARIQQLYPASFFPPVTLALGRFTTSGATGAAGMVIGMEFYGADAHAPLGELDPFARANQVSLREDFPPLVAHEHAHILQFAAGNPGMDDGATLLARALSEGGADLVGELASGRASYRRKYDAWLPREQEFWTVFAREMHGTDISRWLYNQGNSTVAWPGDLGYFMGYRICAAYYAQASNKAVALRELIAQRDPDAILRISGYAGGGPLVTPSDR